MCGRYACYTPADTFAERFGAAGGGAVVPRYNLAPTQASLLCRNAPWAGGGREMVALRWGLVPSWAKDLSIGNRLINARSETADTAPSFRKAFAQRRCLIAADGFYEWTKPRSGPHQPWFFRLIGGEPFAFAGLWARWNGSDGIVDSCTILTTEANEAVGTVHDRMPVIVAPAHYARWMDRKMRDRGALGDILQPYPAQAMEGWPVDRRVNNPKVDEAALIKRA